MTAEFMVLRWKPMSARWELIIPGVGTVSERHIGSVLQEAKTTAAGALGVPASSVGMDIALPVDQFRYCHAVEDNIGTLLGMALAGMGQVLAEMAAGKPCDTSRRYGSYGWLRDGTPAIFL